MGMRTGRLDADTIQKFMEGELSLEDLSSLHGFSTVMRDHITFLMVRVNELEERSFLYSKALNRIDEVMAETLLDRKTRNN